MTDFIPSEKGVPIRMPSQANLQIDSSDRGTYLSASGTSGNFSIIRPANLLNGFFTRITPVEIALDWRIPNVGPTESTSDSSNNMVQVDVSGASTIDTHVIFLGTGCYSCADALDVWLVAFNQLTGYDFALINNGNMTVAIQGKDVSGNGIYWRFSGGPTNNRLMGSLGFNVNAGLPGNPFAFVKFNTYTISGAQGVNNGAAGYGLSKYKYLDFTCPQLTNQQDVKDGTTNKFFNQDSIFRWYLGTTTDSPPAVDKYGFPVYPTDKQFYIRRHLACPKNIKWEANIPLGNLDFQVYATRWLAQDATNPATFTTLLDRNEYSWQMTLQASEV